VTIQVDLSLQFGSLSPGTGAPIIKKWEEFFQDQVSIVAIIGRSINMTINLDMIDFTIAMCSIVAASCGEILSKIYNEDKQIKGILARNGSMYT